jgi:hypothetical protein
MVQTDDALEKVYGDPRFAVPVHPKGEANGNGNGRTENAFSG